MKHVFPWQLFALATTLSSAPLTFDFGPGPLAEGFTQVSADTVYSPEKGYGFEPGSVIFGVDRGGDPLTGDFVHSDKPFAFSVKLPEGTYRVTMTLGDPDGESRTTVKAEARRLMLEDIRTQTGKGETRSFLVNLRSVNLPNGAKIKQKERELTSLDWDDKLTLEFNNSRPCLCALAVEKVEDSMTVFLAGDSTVTDQQFEPWSSWGAMLPRFFGPDVAVANYAESGESVASFTGARRSDKILATMRKGDYLFIQFGHNDMKDTSPAALTGYKDRMRKLLTSFRDKGGIPVLVTSVHRRSFDRPGKVIVNSLGEYPETVRKLAEEEKVALIDLHAMTQILYEAMGAEVTKKAFVDSTHHTNYGGYEIARCVVEGIRQAKLGLASKLAPDAGTFDPAKPDPVASFSLPASPQRDPAKPEGD